MRAWLRWALGGAIGVQAAHLAIVLGAIGAAAYAGGGNPVGHLGIGVGGLIVHFLIATALISVCLPVLVHHAQRTDRLDDAGRRRWLVLLALWGPVTMPVYWWNHLRVGPSS